MKLNLLGEWLSWIEESEQCQSDFDTPYLDDTSTESLASTQQNHPDVSRQFKPVKQLCERDYIIIDLLNSASKGATTVSLCVSDPSQLDNPVIYISDGFTKLTGYEYDEVVGRNCRFLQGPETDRTDVQVIIDAIKNKEECSVKLLNYKKDGTTFRNEVSLDKFYVHLRWDFVDTCAKGPYFLMFYHQFYLANLKSPTQDIAYFIGIQAAINEDDTMDDFIPSNPGVGMTMF